MATTSTDHLAPLHRLSIQDYQRMGETGILGKDSRVELAEGVLVDMMKIGLPHGRAVVWLDRWFTRQLPEELAAWMQTEVVLPGLDSPSCRPMSPSSASPSSRSGRRNRPGSSSRWATRRCAATVSRGSVSCRLTLPYTRHGAAEC